ncbi:MAG: hypothetical protein HN485_09585 [Rhodospirillaceae bacterium]|nr:hypothetical protein [Rhodospirillaceae bacterium]
MLDRPANELFAERKHRVANAVALCETGRVPFIFFSLFWPAKLAGITFEEAMHDPDKLDDAYGQAVRLLQPDGFAAMQMIISTGRAMEVLDYKQIKWPGTGTEDDVDSYCKNLIEKVGKGGGFILDGSIGTPDEAKVENVLAMAQSVHKYAN